MPHKIIIQEILKKEKNLESQFEKCLSSEELKEIYPYLYAIKEIKYGTKVGPYFLGIIPLKEYFENGSKVISPELIESIRSQINNIEKIMLKEWPDLITYANRKEILKKMIPQDYSNKRWLNDFQGNKTLGRKIKDILKSKTLRALSVVTLATLISYNYIPPVKKGIDYIVNVDKKVITHFKDYTLNNISDVQEIIIPKNMTLNGYGKQYGLEGQALGNWVNINKMNNFSLKSKGRDDIGIDEKGNLYEGKKLYLTKP